MTGILLDGNALAKNIEAELTVRVQRLKDKSNGKSPILATILVGDDPASETYVRMKGNACKRVGMESLKVVLPQNTTTDELLGEIDKLNANATVTICHSKTQELPEIVSQADIIVGAVGKPEFIKGAWIKAGAIVVDAGYHPGKVGDIELSAVIDKCSAYTPVPGGVGPMTIATLIAQTVEAAEKSI
jgi:5,10-methylene-tetrahydrofolate dehydrogenase/methenyl tetrahydrofolate cyclohydrolase